VELLPLIRFFRRFLSLARFSRCNVRILLLQKCRDIARVPSGINVYFSGRQKEREREILSVRTADNKIIHVADIRGYRSV